MTQITLNAVPIFVIRAFEVARCTCDAAACINTSGCDLPRRYLQRVLSFMGEVYVSNTSPVKKHPPRGASEGASTYSKGIVAISLKIAFRFNAHIITRHQMGGPHHHSPVRKNTPPRMWSTTHCSLDLLVYTLSHRKRPRSLNIYTLNKHFIEADVRKEWRADQPEKVVACYTKQTQIDMSLCSCFT